MRRFEFHFDFRSPYSYLALSQLPSLDAEILYRPFDVLSVMDRVGNVPTSVVCRPKGDYVKRDMRSEERRVGKECVSTCRSRWAPSDSKKKNKRSVEQSKKQQA